MKSDHSLISAPKSSTNVTTDGVASGADGRSRKSLPSRWRRVRVFDGSASVTFTVLTRTADDGAIDYIEVDDVDAARILFQPDHRGATAGQRPAEQQPVDALVQNSE